MEVVKTMIHDQDLPMHIWDEGARITVYVQNRLSHGALGFDTLEEMYTGMKPKVSHHKIFSISSICSSCEREENQVGSFWKEGNICWIM